MKLFHIIILSLFLALAGIAFLAYQHEWIIIRMPGNTKGVNGISSVSKQPISFFYWHNNELKKETKELIIPDVLDKKTAIIIANWLTYMHEEKMLKNKIVLQSALLDPSNTRLYLSFDQTPFTPQQSTHEKWMFIKGLMETLQQNGIQQQGIYFLVNNAPLEDQQLDFSNAWSM